MYEINKIIKKIRDDNKLTQTEFAAFLSVSHQTVSSWERARTRPTLVMLKKISQSFNIPLSKLLPVDKVPKKSKRDLDKEKLAHAFLCLLSRSDMRNVTMQDIILESGLSPHYVSSLFSTPLDILTFIAMKIEQEISIALEHTTATDPFIILADVILPVLYQHCHVLKILYSKNYANGEWLHFLEQRYIKWMTPFFNNYCVENAPVSRSFAIELSVKMTLSIISTWLTQPIPETPETFRVHFLQLTKMSITDIATL